MLAKYWRLRMKWDADQTLTYDNGARIAIRMTPWKIASAAVSYDTTITDDLGFGSGETIVDEGEVEGTVQDNTSNLYWAIKGYFEITADATSTDGTAYLYLEESDDNTHWPSDCSDFHIASLTPIAVLSLSTDAEDENAATNFEF